MERLLGKLAALEQELSGQVDSGISDGGELRTAGAERRERCSGTRTDRATRTRSTTTSGVRERVLRSNVPRRGLPVGRKLRSLRPLMVRVRWSARKRQFGEQQGKLVSPSAPDARRKSQARSTRVLCFKPPSGQNGRQVNKRAKQVLDKLREVS